MSNPAEALPLLVSDSAIQALLTSKGFPAALSIAPLKVTAEYHALYLIALSQPAARQNSHRTHSELVLRVSGRHLPAIKTRNEVAVMTWLRRNTSIPVPELVAFDTSEDNPIGHEYSLLSKVTGATLSDVYTSLNEAQQSRVLNQLVDYFVELHSVPWDGIGGLRLEDETDPESTVIMSQVVDETFWQTQDITKFWPKGESVASLNIRGPFKTYIDLVSAQIQQYTALIQKHDSLTFMRDTLPRLSALVNVLSARNTAANDPDKLNQVAIRLAHKDLHFANILVEPSSANITAIIDWEFAGVVPFTEWNPRQSFLWNAQSGDESYDEKKKWMAKFEEMCRERGVGYILEDTKFSSPLQESMNKLHNYLRAIVEVSPRGQRQDLVQDWKGMVLENLALFGV